MLCETTLKELVNKFSETKKVQIICEDNDCMIVRIATVEIDRNKYSFEDGM